jgi:hypothetical protein
MSVGLESIQQETWNLWVLLVLDILARKVQVILV